jgi:hypothetical protein
VVYAKDGNNFDVRGFADIMPANERLEVLSFLSA